MFPGLTVDALLLAFGEALALALLVGFDLALTAAADFALAAAFGAGCEAGSGRGAAAHLALTLAFNFTAVLITLVLALAFAFGLGLGSLKKASFPLPGSCPHKDLLEALGPFSAGGAGVGSESAAAASDSPMTSSSSASRIVASAAISEGIESGTHTGPWALSFGKLGRAECTSMRFGVPGAKFWKPSAAPVLSNSSWRWKLSKRSSYSDKGSGAGCSPLSDQSQRLRK